MIGGGQFINKIPPPNWPAGVPFPPPPGTIIPVLSGSNNLGAHQAKLMQSMQNIHQQTINHFIQSRMQNWQPSVSGGNSFFNNQMPSPPPMPGSRSFVKPDPNQPDTLGWREWSWSDADKMLKSPSQGTLWPEAELVVPNWDDGEAVRGVSGIHAHLVPKHWKIVGHHHAEYVPSDNPMRVHGIVERFGKYVLGTEGWRAEWVVIKELMAPSTEVGLAIERAYPDVVVHYPEEEGDPSCTSEKSLKLGKGNRSTSRPKPSPQPSQSPSPSSSLASPSPRPRNLSPNLIPSGPPMHPLSVNASLYQSNRRHLSVSLNSNESEKPEDYGAVIVMMSMMAAFVLPLAALFIFGMGR